MSMMAYDTTHISKYGSNLDAAVIYIPYRPDIKKRKRSFDFELVCSLTRWTCLVII